jgi:thiamine-phosphate pyrophosphorylase
MRDAFAFMQLPRLYAIIDAEVCRAHSITPAEMASQLVVAGVILIQYRDKPGSPQEILANSAAIRAAAPTAALIMNDRPDLAALATFNGVHLGQSDLPPADARLILGPNALIGLSTHTPNEVELANQTPIDYLAIGPIFSTLTKQDADPPVGLEGIRRARALTTKPLIAIGGITRVNGSSVLAAGADSIAVISALFSPTESVEQVGRDFLRILR